jgi:hypothetical protein
MRLTSAVAAAKLPCATTDKQGAKKSHQKIVAARKDSM